MLLETWMNVKKTFSHCHYQSQIGSEQAYLAQISSQVGQLPLECWPSSLVLEEEMMVEFRPIPPVLLRPDMLPPQETLGWHPHSKSRQDLGLFDAVLLWLWRHQFGFELSQIRGWMPLLLKKLSDERCWLLSLVLAPLACHTVDICRSSWSTIYRVRVNRTERFDGSSRTCRRCTLRRICHCTKSFELRLQKGKYFNIHPCFPMHNSTDVHDLRCVSLHFIANSMYS